MIKFDLKDRVATTAENERMITTTNPILIKKLSLEEALKRLYKS